MADVIWDADYAVGFVATDDPRVFAVIEREDHYSQPDGDCYAPTLAGSGWGMRDYENAYGAQDADFLADVVRAVNYFGETFSMLDEPGSLAARYLRIFHGVLNVYTASSSFDRYANAVIFDTVAWRERMGIALDAVLSREDVASDWIDYLNGDVYRVGYALNEAQVLPLPAGTAPEGWEVLYGVGNVYGERWAVEIALDDETLSAVASLPALLWEG